MSGRVVDQQGSAVPNATVTATEPNKNTTNTAKTNDQGEFSMASLQPGIYTVSVEAAGFKKLDRRNTAVDANTKLSLGDIALQVGAVTESIEVSASAAALQTESVERSASITGKQVENIQVNGRNPLDMAKLIPGVVSTANVSAGGVGGLSGLQVNGNRGTSNQLTINGISDVDTGSNGGQNVTVSQDSMAEFKILTGTYQAEYGRNAGAQISLVTKSGTDQFHGSGYWYHRHDDLNANTFINNARGLSKPLFRYNDPGYTIGGPVYIPKIMEQTKSKLFFFWSQEWQKQLLANTEKRVTVPTADERNGIFTATRDNNGNLLTVLNDPLGGTFPNKVIPQSRFYGPGVAVLKLYPLPNINATGYNYTSQFSGQSPRREDLLRLDYNMTSNLRFFGHWINNLQDNLSPYGSFVLGPTVPIANILDHRPGKSLAAGGTWIINPTMTNEANWGFTKNSIDITETTSVLRRKTSGINLPLLYPNALQDDYIPNLQFNGTHLANSPTFVSNDAPFHNYNTTIDFSDNLTKVWGKHTIKAGFFMQRSRKDQTSFNDNNGTYNFGDSQSNPLDTGYGYSNALLGVYNTFQQASSYINGQYRYWNIEQFVQDTWKLTPRLTLDFGLRGQWYQPQFDSSLQASTFVPQIWDPKKAPRLYFPAINPANGSRAAYDSVTNTYLPAGNVGLEIPGSGDPFNGICQATKCVNKYLQRNRGEQWGPRFGFAWDVTGKQDIVIRAGSGIYYDRFQGNRVFDSVRNPPESVQPVFNQGFAQDVNPNNVLLGPPNLFMADPVAKIPTVTNYQLSVQARLPWKMMMDAAYVGSISRHLQDNRNLNYVPYGATYQKQNQDPQKVAASPNALLGNNALTQPFLVNYYGYNNITLYESQATANYNSLQLSLNRRANDNLFFGVAYTYSKTLTTATSDSSSVRVDQFQKLANYGPANFDRRHVLAINYVYTTPKLKYGNGFTHVFTDRWQLSGVTQATTGSPFTPGYSISGSGNSTTASSNTNITGSSTEASRIGIVKGCNPYTGSSDPFNRLNAACFFAPSPGSIGTESGVNFLYSPGVINFDLALQKEFVIAKEGRARLQFRVDAFNVFNHSNFTGLNTTLNFKAYPTSGGVVTGSPGLAATALGINDPANGCNATNCFNQTGFGTATQPAPGALGYARILQTLVRIQF
ncbi:MAG: hypothetical protein QOJ99_204 [Bryobacterales bacterium]|jgi:outer membrane receptor protein involved in Fe transport|nr:hypothetical protein [Bryobacterales bacterium]